MRPRIIIPVLLLAVVLLAIAFAPKLFRADKSVAPVASGTNVVASNPVTKPVVVATGEKQAAANPVTVAVVTPAVDPAQQIERLQSLAMNNDADSLKEILAGLSSPDPQVRVAAREAAVQFGDKSAAPVLREAAENVSDPHEKIALLEAADYLELPPLEFKPSTNPPPHQVRQP